MGKTYKRYDKDDVYHNVKQERNNASQIRKKKHSREELYETYDSYEPSWKNKKR